MPLVTLTTDFGGDSPYVAAMKGVILSINPSATIVDITHSVPPQDICAGALILSDAYAWFPKGTIHVAVVDPGVGTARSVVCIENNRHLFVGPDNGLLTLAAAPASSAKTYEIVEPRFYLPEISSTFHGRDIMAPAAAHLSTGIMPGELGPPLGEWVCLKLPEPVVLADQIDGEVLWADSFGNLITNITVDGLGHAFGDVEQAARHVSVTCGPHEIRGIVHTYQEAESATPVALIGSSGRLELAIVDGNAATQLAIGHGDRVTVQRRRALA